MSIKGTLDTTGYIKVASTKFTVDATGNTYADGTLTVMGAAGMNNTLNVKLDATLQSDMIMTADSAADTLGSHWADDQEHKRLCGRGVGALHGQHHRHRG